MASIGHNGWLGGGSLGQRGCHGLSLSGHSSVHHGWSSINVCQTVNRVICIAVKAALATLFVLQVIVKEPMALAICAIDPEDILEQVRHDPIRLLHLDFLVALRAGQILAGLVIFRDISLHTCKLY